MARRLTPSPAARRIAAAVVAAACSMTSVGAEPPVAPAPESLVGEAAVEPAAFVADASLGGERPASTTSRPVPLKQGSADRATASSAHRPLPDWRLLAALAAAFAAVGGYRLLSGRRAATLPPDVFEVLGEAPLGGQQSVRVVRFGPRTLLLGLSPAGCQTLAELVDPQATECVVAACRGSRGRGTPSASAGRSRRSHRGHGPAAAEATA